MIKSEWRWAPGIQKQYFHSECEGLPGQKATNLAWELAAAKHGANRVVRLHPGTHIATTAEQRTVTD